VAKKQKVSASDNYVAVNAHNGGVLILFSIVAATIAIEPTRNKLCHIAP
jgi:hypothetical protein